MTCIRSVWFLLLALVPARVACVEFESRERSAANPIRRVVTLLQKMQAQVAEEGKTEEELFNKFICYCKTGSGDLKASIKAAEDKTSADSGALKEAEAQSAQLAKDLAEHKANRADAQDASEKATALRKKEAGIFARDSSDHKTNLAALGNAISAIEAGVGGSFLQTSAAAQLRQLTIDADMSSVDRDALAAFLSEHEGQRYAPQSGEITGILKQMKDTMSKDLADMTAAEKQAVADYKALMSAKKKEIDANSVAIEAKTQRAGQVAVDIVDLKEALDDTAKALAADRKFLSNLGSNCDAKKAEWEARSKTRVDELAALADTIRLLNDDDALELFKKTLPSPSFLQVQVRSEAVRQQALRLLRTASQHRDPRMEFVMLALTGKSNSFDKVLKMIDEMVTLLGSEQKDDDAKKAYCEESLDKSEDAKKALDQTIADLNKAIASAKDAVANLAAEIAALIHGVQSLDTSVKEATENRKAENTEFKATMSANKAAKELIGMAKNRLNKFYNPSLYVAPKKQELSSEERIAVNMGSETAPTVTPSGIAGTGISYFQQGSPVFAQVSLHSKSGDSESPAPPPETWNAYQKKGQEHNGVTAMIDLLESDLEKDMTEASVDEKNAQAEYETMMSDSQAKRAEDSKAIADKEGNKAELEARLEKMGAEHASTMKEAYATATTIKDLHLECDWLLSSFGARKDARSGEVESLNNAKAVLSGADYSLIQMVPSRTLQLRGSSVA